MLLKRASFFLFFVFTWIGHGLAQNYGTPVSYHTGTFPIGIARGDFNHDGNLDIVVANFSSNSLSVLLGNGDGTFQPATTVLVGTNPISVAVADFDGDGNLDLAVALEQSPGLQLLMGRGDGTFGPPAALTLPGFTIGPAAKVVSADFNDDGKPDLAIAGTTGVQLLLNIGGGNFVAGDHFAGVATDVAVADLNGDGHSDLLYVLLASTACGVEGELFVQLGNGDGTFQGATQLPVVLSDPLGIAIADFNKDGRLDLAVVDRGFGVCPSGSITNGSVQILLQQPDGSFRSSATISSVIHPDGVIAGDFDGDGNPDLAVLQAATAGVTPVPPDAVLLYLGDGSGQFTGPHQFQVGGGPEGLVAAPLTNTGALDIVVSDAGSDSISVLVNRGANTVSLSSSVNPSAVFGQVTLIATVQPVFSGSGTLSGSMTFSEGATKLGTASVNSSGTASLTVSFSTAGDHALDAVFSGNPSFVGGSSGSLHQIVDRAVPAVTLVSLPNPSLSGQPVTFQAAVTAVPSGTIPSGSISLNMADLTIGAAVLDATGKAVIPVSSLPAGVFTITAFYSGDTKYAEAFSVPVVQTVNKSPSVSTLAVNPATSIFGQLVTFTAVVRATGGGAGIPGGMVRFDDAGKSIGIASLDGTGKASLAVSSLNAGNHTITASYAGDSNFLASVSGIAALTVGKSATTTNLSSMPNPSVFGQGITLTVVVAASAGGAGTPLGLVTIQDGSVTLGTVTMDSTGKATLSLSSLAVGSHNLAASYAGDANFKASFATGAQGVTQVVNPSSTVTTISSSANPAEFGQTIALTASVVAGSGGAGTPSGTVTFRDGMLSLASATLDPGGKATVALSSLAVGTHSITAAYNGNINYLVSVSGTLNETVNRALPIVIIGDHDQDFTIALSQPSGQISAGQSFTSDVVLTPVNGLTGAVATLCSGTPEGTTCSVNADASAFDGKTPINAKLVVTTTAPNTAAILASPSRHRGLPWVVTGLSLGLGLVFLPFASKRSRKCVLVAVVASALAGCGGSHFKTQTLVASTPPGTYTITVQSQSGSLVHSVPVVLVVK